MMERNWSCGFMQRYVVTLDLAKRLKASGWKKETAFQWYSHEYMDGKWALGRVDNDMFRFMAPMDDELLEEFPRNTVQIIGSANNFMVKVGDLSLEKWRTVDALAELWILRKKTEGRRA